MSFIVKLISQSNSFLPVLLLTDEVLPDMAQTFPCAAVCKIKTDLVAPWLKHVHYFVLLLCVPISPEIGRVF